MWVYRMPSKRVKDTTKDLGQSIYEKAVSWGYVTILPAKEFAAILSPPFFLAPLLKARCASGGNCRQWTDTVVKC